MARKNNERLHSPPAGGGKGNRMLDRGRRHLRVSKCVHESDGIDIEGICVGFFEKGVQKSVSLIAKSTTYPIFADQVAPVGLWCFKAKTPTTVLKHSVVVRDRQTTLGWPRNYA